MTEYVFADMTASQALFITNEDLIRVTVGSGTQTTVIFNDNLTYNVTIAGRTLTFGNAFRTIANAVDGLIFPDGSGLYIGGLADDVVFLPAGAGRPANGAAYGGPGANRFNVSGNWLLQGNQGDDRISATTGRYTIYGGQDNDTIELGTDQASFAQGNRGNDSILGGFGRDTLLGGQGNDTISGRGNGPSFINGNLGDDRLSGEGQLLGEDGADTISAGFEDLNTVRGGAGDDRIVAAGSDLSTLGGRNLLFGDDGDDFIQSLSPRRDEMFGGSGNDRISSVNQNDVGDLQDGGDGDDVLSGGVGGDTLVGGGGADTLTGQVGADLLTGGMAPTSSSSRGAAC